ncbi:MAG TPA: RDD family protein [Hyphomonas sp.]|nr:RDD family protein [Hyphomonas sp.]HRK68473.1 RDD family protein [Hyphomonas sp.]
MTPPPARPGISMEAAVQRRARMAEEMRNAKTMRRMVTPEGAAIQLKLGSASERAGAFMIDVAIQWAIVIATLLGLSFVSRVLNMGSSNIAFAFWLVFFFFVRNFYYIIFEIGQRAATPGKRILGLRVAARDGGRLTANSVLARNFIREIEVGLPFQFAMMGATDAMGGWLVLFGLVWSCVFLLFPVFNRDKMRVGDLIAGTWVIKTPKVRLMEDITSATSRPETGPPIVFTQQQAEAYGIHELHVLEDVLRQSTPAIKAQVAARIRAKIGWENVEGETDLAFLEAYYAALRRRLEQRMLLGERKADKYDTR